MTALNTARSVVSHRGMSCLDLHRLLGDQERELRRLRSRAEQATAMEARLDEQAKTINSLRDQVQAAKTIRGGVHAKAGRYDEAEARAASAERQLSEMTKELVALRAFRDNVNAVDVPQVGAREVDPDDHPTDPQGIDVRALWEARDAGLLGPVTDPGHTRPA